jgi:hypothetical protein
MNDASPRYYDSQWMRLQALHGQNGLTNLMSVDSKWSVVQPGAEAIRAGATR